MIKNFFKIKVPLINKNYFKYKIGDKGKYKYKGTAYILIEKSTGNIAFNTLLLDERQEIYGADDGKYGKEYMRKNIDLFKYRKSSFNYSIPIGKLKNSSLFKKSIKEFNNIILKNKLTIKDVDSFISGSHSSGGLRNPSNDPVRIFYEFNDPIKKIFNLKQENIQWKFFSLISNIKGKFNNKNFNENLTIDFLHKIEEKPIDFIFNELNWKLIPYKESNFKDCHIPFKEAFKSQNVELFNLMKDINYTNATPLKVFNKINYVDYIINILKKGDKRGLNRELRLIWRRIIDEDIKNKKYKTDFIKGISRYDRAHIIENKTIANILLDGKFDIDKKREYLKELFNNNNYILLTKDIHDYWDKKLIIIEENGEIINFNLPDHEFNLLISKYKNIYSIYPNVLNFERKRLIEERKKWN